MKKRFIALLLCCVMLFTLSPSLIASAAADDDVAPAQTGVTVSPANADLPRNEKVPLTAQAKDAKSFQWQIQAGNTLWVDISGETGSTIQVSYAMVASLLSGNKVALRCKTDVGTSAAVTVTVTEPQAEPQVESQMEPQADSPLASQSVMSYARANTSQNDVAAYDISGTGETPSTTYNVVINYVFENGSLAADPYTASLAAGSNFSATVTFPTVQGYLPYVGEATESTISMDLNITNIQEDVTHTVVYKPTNVNYTVIHSKQNLNDDNYTEAERETKQGLTNSTVPDVAKTYEGFYALLYEKPAIAADGSTVVEIHYDRYYYLMNFDLDGGYGVEPIYARYGTPIGNVGTPTKAGYTFNGWSLDGTNTVDLPTAMPAANKTYKAVWEADNTAKVTVVFWGENANDEEYSYIKSAQVNVKPGTEFTFTVNGVLTCTEEEHDHIVSGCTLICKNTHTHTLACYGLTSSDKTDMNSRLERVHLQDFQKRYGSFTSGMVYMYDGILDNYYYLYFNGSWYKASSALGSDGEMAKAVKCTYSHTHTDACYGCGKTEHTHDSGCYMGGAGLDSNLWKFVKSDTVTVAADGSSVVNVYYDRTEKTLTFKYNYSKRNYQSTEAITAKWGSNIAEQYKEIAAKAGSSFWSAQTSGDGPYTNYFGVMPQTSATYYNRGTTGSTGTMTYWGQDLNGDYTVKLFEVTGVGGYTVTDEDRYEFEGYTYHHGTSNGSDCEGAEFYYTRNSYTLTFNDGYDDVRKESVKYEAPLSAYSSYVPDVPSAYEAGSVTFGGWYLNPECTGAEYKLDEHNMPADNVLLYAKWVPVSHTVEFYLDRNALNAGAKLDTHSDITVPHGSKADPVPAAPTNGSYTFIGWFYMENGVEKAFDFANMPVTKDMQVYGKWSSNVLKEYTIYYKIQDTDTEIAAPTTGSALAGVTKTFEAKGGTDLYADYQECYFPVTKSHSLTLDINATEENDTNTFTFWYVQKEAVPYTVKYLNKETGKPLAGVPEKTVSDNRKAVVTETFVPVSGMLPDAYQKRLVVSAEEGAVNEIIFYYTEDTTHAYYKITHYTENLAKDAQGNTTWTEYASSQIVGNVGMTNYSAAPMSISGFSYQKIEYVVNGGTPSTTAPALTTDGLEINLYYTRNSYPYQVRYLEQGTGKELHAPKNETGKYGEVISESAISIDNYDAVAPTSQTLNIKIEESQTEAKLNIITFYYKEKEVTISYQVVGPDGCGTVTPTSETLKVLTGTAQGSTPTASSGFRFVGWYTDAACTTPVNDGWVDANNKLTPVKATAAWTAATYYAKFEYDITDLTITKKVTGDMYDNNQSFVFTVTGDDLGTLTVVLNAGNNFSVTIKDLKVGATYTVTEKTDWSWRYELKTVDRANNGCITLEADKDKNTIEFTNRLENPYWLSGNTYRDNRWQTIEAVLRNINVGM